MRAGDPLIELYGTKRFVLGYVPTGTLYSVAVGDPVQIKVGLQTLQGTITRVESVAAALPREFQRSFVPVDTRQLIRVEFAPGKVPPPLFTKVNLRSDHIRAALDIQILGRKMTCAAVTVAVGI